MFLIVWGYMCHLLLIINYSMFLQHGSIMLYKIVYLPSLVIVLNVLYYFTVNISLCISSFHIEYARR